MSAVAKRPLILTIKMRQGAVFGQFGIRSVEVVGEEIRTEAMDHHGVVAAVCKERKIAESIDQILYQEDTGQVVTPGESVVAMIINRLGFTHRRWYLMGQFFKKKPIEKLIAPGLRAEPIIYDALAATPDDIGQCGTD